MEAGPRRAKLLAAMLGPVALAQNSPGSRGSGPAQGRLTEPIPDRRAAVAAATLWQRQVHQFGAIKR
eukprot:13206572-Alexandrium_andersonii.AAC.1